ncbi:ABC transporter permease [Psychromicrobium lacuslunae]|uniref:ABC transporter permease n=1 Tax=Psychromicrobium lacuslunae TaxID=1618207 RepID=A0A0D4C3G2_9MICC|nr:ABC transporter permease [Psychromicrobium lacuslunae]
MNVPEEPGLGSAPERQRRWYGLVIALSLLALIGLSSLLIGSGWVPFDRVWQVLLAPDDSMESTIVWDFRVPRTLLGLLVGSAMGVAGALIQALTRNPLADPGILGVNAGAAFTVTLGVAVFGITQISTYLWFALLGAVLTTLAVYRVAARGRGGPTPVRLTLVGIAVAAVLSGISNTLALIDPNTFDRMRYWGAGTIADRPAGTILAVLPFIVGGLVLSALLARPLNAMALGEELATSFGTSILRTRLGCIVAITLLCGAGTAAAGPISFIGLMVPHLVRWFTGPDQRWILALTALAAPALLLLADLLGRVMQQGELQVGIVTALIGAPVLILLVRRRRLSEL